MIRFVRLACGLSLAVTVALPACSSSDGNGPDPGSNASAFSSGLPRDQSYASVTDADIGNLCEAWANYVIGPVRGAFCKSRVWGGAAAALNDAEAMGCGPGVPCTRACLFDGSVCTGP